MLKRSLAVLHTYTHLLPFLCLPNHPMQCISNDKFGCSQAEDDCCTDFMCRANQNALACK